jgi:hypothetical protein
VTAIEDKFMAVRTPIRVGMVVKKISNAGFKGRAGDHGEQSIAKNQLCRGSGPNRPQGQKSASFSTSLFLRAGNRQEDAIVEDVVIGWRAEVFPDLRAGHQFRCGFGGHPRLLVGLGVGDGKLGFQR